MSEINEFVDEIETPPLEEWMMLDIKNRMLELGDESREIGLIAAPPSDLYSKKLMLGGMQNIKEFRSGRLVEQQTPKGQQSVKPKEFRNQSSCNTIGKSSRSETNQVFSKHTNFKWETAAKQRQHHAMHSQKFSHAKAVTEKDDNENELAQTYSTFNSELSKLIREAEDIRKMQVNTNGKKMVDASNRFLSERGLDECVILEEISNETYVIRNKITPQSTTENKEMQKQISRNDVFLQNQELHSKETQSENQIEQEMWNGTGKRTVHKTVEFALNEIKDMPEDPSQKDFKNKSCENYDNNIDQENDVNWQDDTHKMNHNAVENSYKIKYETNELTTATEIAKSNQLKMRSISENETVGIVHYQHDKDTCKSTAENVNEANEGCDNDDKRQDEYYIVPVENTSKLHEGENSSCDKNSVLDKVSDLANKERTKESKELAINDKLEVNFEICSGKDTEYNENTNVLYNNYENNKDNDGHKHQTKDKDEKPKVELNKEATTEYDNFEQLITVSSPKAFHKTKLSEKANKEKTQNTKDYSDSKDIEDYVIVDPYSELSETPSAASHSLFQRVGKMASALFTSISSAKDTKHQMEQRNNTMDNFEANSKLQHSKIECLDATSNSYKKSLASVCKDDEIVTVNENCKANIDDNKTSSEIRLQIKKNVEKTATMAKREVHIPSNVVKDTSGTTWQLQSAEIINNTKLVNDDKSNTIKTEENIVKENKKPEHNDTDHNKQEFNDFENPIESTLENECELELQNNIGTVVKKENEAHSTGNSTVIKCFSENEVNHKKHITKSKGNKENMSINVDKSKKVSDEARNMDRSTKRVMEKKQKLYRMTSLDLFSALVDDIVPPSTCSSSIKVMIIHSDEDSDLATEMVERLRKEFNFRAAAECQISILRTMSPYSYQKGAMNWADIIVPIITNTWLDDISNIVSSSSRSKSSLSARQGYMMLRNKMMNGVNYNWHVVCAVKEGTDQRYRSWPEFFNAIPIWKQFRKLGKTIIDVHNLPRFIN